MKFNFKEWLIKEGFATAGKIGLYPPIDDALGQYPPLYATARIPDVITYIDIAYHGKEPPGEDGFIKHTKRDLLGTLAAHKAKHKVWNFPSSLGKPETTG